MSKPETTLASVQALRGVAALLVVAYHIVNVWRPEAWPNGSTGVDLFFVISGLVMTLAADRSPSWRSFLQARLVRIVPLYWLATTAKLVLTLAIPALALRTRHDPAYVLGSYAFWPMHNAAGEWFPLLPPGWTLSYEWLFYALVAWALWSGRSVLAIAIPALIAFACLAVVDGGWANTIALEFLFGALIGTALKRSPLPWQFGVMLVPCFLMLLVLPVGSATLRPLTWGLAAAGIVAGAVALEPLLRLSLPRWSLALGDASYSIYLTHLFVLPVALAILPRSLPLMLAVGLVACSVAGWLCYVWVERPMLRAMRRSGKADAPSGHPVGVLLPAGRVLRQ